ncbi:YtxH domain-containing protein [Arthrobacter antioxidans]|uniref:YtxH domain-containing protein n=1 Tax=Arthrobacter antioxidans TaxID=2895818 RepID=UPI001FFE9DBC|nr:YtxH domain-containing protein [Arthrobacter antioxidans]
MKNKLVFAAGMAVGYVLGTRAGRESYEQLKTKAQELWENPKVQDTVASTTDTIKSKAPEVQDSLKGALKKGETGKGGKAKGGAGTTGTTGPSGGNPRDVEDTPFQAQDSETRPELGKDLGK